MYWTDVTIHNNSNLGTTLGADQALQYRDSFCLCLHAGWGLSDMEVWRGFLVTIGWFLLFLIVAGFALRLRK